ncbi:glycoside hydrolase family 97 catalytic domain-containing protein [Polaribacter haliotis]|uniref:Glycoside hydrolase family 97 catalytic domain-containing protein n=1 Tax=Polaribacter haliotis TaxID=1888915 RepID=A0A7L8AII4_9FLAO|nr:glycoside hydrolase family 97 protein [Polaribacter haliotis]QOD61816.1 glycoside hydrolase family 97 catalytic domain-containing protein [Polaribacter haliotis]
MKKYISSTILVLAMLIFTSCQTEKVNKNEISLTSPSENLSLEIHKEATTLNLVLKQSNLEKLNIDLAGILKDTEIFKNGFEVKEITKTSHKEMWEPLYGERNKIIDNYNNALITIADTNNANSDLEIECRLYDEGVAFRYIFKGKAFENVVLKQESTAFEFDKDYQTWATDVSQGHYSKTTINSIGTVAERPFVIKQNDSSYLALGEAALVNYARGKFKKHANKSHALQIELDGEVDLKKANYKSPWRYVMVGKTPGNLLENNYFLENLNEPNQIEDVSWIKPGKVIREVTLTTKGGKACVDFAVKHNLQYIEFDAGWYGHEYDDAEDASTITVDPDRSPGPLDLHEVIAYGKEKGIGVLLYINQRAMSKQLDQVLPLYESWGIAGVKYGFVNVGSQKWTIWLHEAIRKAAKHHLMVDIHDDYRPTGYSRTYPNLMTQEGIRGDEESPSVSHSITTLFTRMLVGAGDNTNCFLAARVSEKMGGKSAQMAKSIMLYSPWQFLFWYDRPENSPHKVGGAGENDKVLRESDALKFYDALPTVWDDTKILESHMEDYATIARKSDDNWFVGSLAANKERTLNITFDFLEADAIYEAILYSQDSKGLKENKVAIEKMNIDKTTTFSRKLEKDSGLALVISRK